MKKEVLLAVALGLVVGLIITFGIYNARRAIRSVQQTVNDAVDRVISPASPTPEAIKQLTLTSPLDNTIQPQTSTTVIGTTWPNSAIIVFSQETPFFGTADSSGAFSIPIELEDGSNIIAVFSVNAQGEQEQAERLVVVSSANLDITVASVSATLVGQFSSPTSSASPSITASPSADQAEKNLKERIEKVIEEKIGEKRMERPIAYIGTLERITTDMIAFKTSTNTKSAQLSPTTVLVDGLTRKVIQPSDLEIGKDVIVMGYLRENGFEARRVVMAANSLFPLPKRVLAGRLVELGRTFLRILSRKDAQTEEFALAKSVAYYGLEGQKTTNTMLAQNDEVIVALDATNQASPSAMLIKLLKTTTQEASPSPTPKSKN